MGIEPKVITETTVIGLVGSKNIAGAQIDPATEDTLALIKAKTDNLDLALTALRDALAGVGAAAKTLADIVTALANMSNLDAAVSTLATEATLAAQLDIALSALRDAITGTGAAAKTLADVVTALANLTNLDAALSTIASETTLGNVKTAVESAIYRATTPVIYNVTMTNLNTEYSQALPANTKKFLVKTRDGTSFRVAFVTGKVATPTEPYLSIGANATYYEDFIQPATSTLYFGCGSAGKVVEIVAWS